MNVCSGGGCGIDVGVGDAGIVVDKLGSWIVGEGEACADGMGFRWIL